MIERLLVRRAGRRLPRRLTRVSGALIGTVGVIGPTRMRYQRAIAVVDGVSRAVTRLLVDGQ